MNARRIARLQEHIKQRIAEILQRDIADPRLGLVTVTRVELDPEFTECKAYWSVLGDAKARAKSESVLRRAQGFVQRTVGRSLDTRTIPHLQFVFDEGIARAIGMNTLLQQLKEDRESREQKPVAGLGLDGDAESADLADPVDDADVADDAEAGDDDEGEAGDGDGEEGSDGDDEGDLNSDRDADADEDEAPGPRG